jgi:riboflavin kinase/FMN adenylyltransferase
MAMRIVRGFDGLDLGLRRSAVTVGNFDGVHRGHQAVMAAAAAAAGERGATSVVCTFDPHTLKVLRPESAPLLLQTVDQRLNAIARVGIDLAVVIPFSHEIAATGRGGFVERFLCDELDVGSLHVSKGFQFGRDRSGKTSYLEERGSALGFDVVRVPPCFVEGVAVSSTRIRDAVRAGDVALAGDLLGRPYAVAGRVVEGAGRGSSLGRPTANVASDNECLPCSGVYSARVRMQEGLHDAVVNVGVRPTFESAGPLVIEAHVLDFDADMYGATVEVELIGRIRDEQRFSDAAALQQRIAADIEAALVQLRGAKA